jgi:ABC-2 type transport system ATP-binding protein
MATHVGIINHGELMFQGTIQELEGLSKPLVQIETDRTVDAANFLKKNNFTVAEVDDHHLFVPYTSKENMGEINALLNQNGYNIYSINKQQQDLEKLFLAITQNA